MSNTDEAADKARADKLRRERVHERHARAAADGIHLPSTRELILGMGFMSSDPAADAKAWSERVMRRIQDNEAGKLVREALETLTVGGWLSAADFINVLSAIDEATDIKRMSALDGANHEQQRLRGINVSPARDRLFLYAACAGDQDCCLRVAQDAVRFARDHDTPSDEVSLFVQAALGFVTLSLDSFHTFRGRASRGKAPNSKAILSGSELLALTMLDSQRDQEPPDDKSAPRNPTADRTVLEGILEADRSQHGAETTSTEPDDIVVVKEIGNEKTSEGKRVAEVFKPVVGVKLPLVPCDRLDLVRESLLEEFPYARRVIDSILNPLEGRKYVHMVPLALIGEPGSGKTTFALKLLKLLGVPSMIYGCGGVADASMAGTARQWQTGGPSIVVSAVVRHRTASVGIVLDEIDRVASNRHNGNIQDALLAMLEPTSARRWYDPYLMAEVDISETTWIATSNDASGIPAALRDRMRIIRFPSPGPEHLESLAIDLRDAILAERGLSSDWALPFAGYELDALREAWPGGSLRALGRLVETTLDVRDHLGDTPLS